MVTQVQGSGVHSSGLETHENLSSHAWIHGEAQTGAEAVGTDRRAVRCWPHGGGAPGGRALPILSGAENV